MELWALLGLVAPGLFPSPGQRRTVTVCRLVATGTIEEQVMALKEGKSRLFGSVVGGGDLADARLTAADVRALLE